MKLFSPGGNTDVSIADPKKTKGLKRWFKLLGTGLITGAADDDPSGIATYSQVGARYGYGMLWTMLFSYPFMVSMQLISARIGRVTGTGIAANMKRHYSKWLLYGTVSLLFIANTINLGADLGAMGAALNLLFGGPILVYIALSSLLSVFLEIRFPYQSYVKYLKWLTAVLFAYVATVVVIKIPWTRALRSTVVPSLSFKNGYFTSLIAVLGTTISPYLFFWQASEETEEIKGNRTEHPLRTHPEEATKQFQRMDTDTVVGMGFSNLIAYFIILVTGTTLFTHGITDIQSAEQAAKALEPLAGRYAFVFFSIGIIGTGLLAIPVLAGSSAFAIGEALQWRVGLEHRFSRAKRFYLVILLSTVIGMSLNLFKFNPIKALFWTAVINGVISVPLMIVIMLMVSNTKVMGRFTAGKWLKVGGWLTTLVMSLAVTAMFLTWGE